MHQVLLLDGLRRVDPTSPVLRADDLGVLRGEAVFETTRIADGRPAFLGAHLARLTRSAQRIDLPLPDGWADLAKAAADGVSDGVLRLVCTKGGPGQGPVGFAVVTGVPEEALRARRDGVRVVTLTLGVTAAERARSPWLLGGVKTTSYAVNMASVRFAQSEGADDAIWLTADGLVLEAPTANVAVVKDGVLATPPPEIGILPGTTVAAVIRMRLITCETRPVTVAELKDADEVMVLSSVRGVAPVVAIDGDAASTGPVTRMLSDAYEAAVRSG